MSSGFSKSSLHRHRQHLGALSLTEPAATRELTTAVLDLGTSPSLDAPTVRRRAARLGRDQLLSRIEMLWSESMSGLEAAKQPVIIKKPDGSIVEVPGDLRARAGFIREGRELVKLQAEATGELVVGPAAAIMIVLPTGTAEPDEQDDFIDITMPRR